MGLLDDAIREHLELKRLRGADPSEIARAEREALGPVRRAVDPAEEDGPEAGPVLAPQTDDQPIEDAGDRPGGALPDDRAGSDASWGTPAVTDHEAAPSGGPHEGPIETPPTEADRWLPPEPTWAEPGEGTERAAAPPAPDEHATQVYRPPSGDPDPAPAAPPAAVRRLPDESHERPAGDRSRPVPDAPAAPARPPLPPAPPGADEPRPGPPAPAEGAEDEDVLEETPDFLQETPEHDRLWFEQRPPRDFDFDK